VNNDETVAHDANDTVAFESSSFNEATVLRRSSRVRRAPDWLTHWYIVLSFRGGECCIDKSFLCSSRCLWPGNACTDYLAVRYYQFIDASVLCGNVSFCVLTLSGVQMLTVMTLCYCFRESYVSVDSTFQ